MELLKDLHFIEFVFGCGVFLGTILGAAVSWLYIESKGKTW